MMIAIFVGSIMAGVLSAWLDGAPVAFFVGFFCANVGFVIVDVLGSRDTVGFVFFVAIYVILMKVVEGALS